MVDKHKILAEFNKHFFTKGEVTIDFSGAVTVTNYVRARPGFDHLETLPVKFERIKGLLYLSLMPNISSFENFPYSLHGLHASINQGFTNFLGAEHMSVNSSIKMENSKLERLEGVPSCRHYLFSKCKNLKSVRGISPTFKVVDVSHCDQLNNIDSLFTTSNDTGGSVSVSYNPQLKLLWPILLAGLKGKHTLSIYNMPEAVTEIHDRFLGAGQGELMDLRRALKQAGFSGNT
jgi:hypothetical protein